MMFLPLADKFNIGDNSTYIILGVLLAVVVIALIVKSRSGKKPTESKGVAEEIAETVSTEASVATENASEDKDAPAEPEIPYIPGYVVLDGVKEQDAAVIMAITSHKTGVDLSRLAFRSIKRLNQNPVLENIEEQDAAAIMAITSDKTGIPLENLIFNSIKLVED